MTPDQRREPLIPSQTPQGLVRVRTPRAANSDNLEPLSTRATAQESSRLRFVADEERRAHQHAQMLEAALATVTALTGPLLIAAEGVRVGVQKFLHSQVHILHARSGGTGFGFNQAREDRVSVEPLMKLCEQNAKRLERSLQKIEPRDQLSLLARGRTIGFQSSLEKFALFIQERADSDKTVGKAELREILGNCVEFKVYTANLTQELNALQVGMIMEGEGQAPEPISDFDPTPGRAIQPRAARMEGSVEDGNSAPDDDRAA